MAAKKFLLLAGTHSQKEQMEGDCPECIGGTVKDRTGRDTPCPACNGTGIKHESVDYKPGQLVVSNADLVEKFGDNKFELIETT